MKPDIKVLLLGITALAIFALYYHLDFKIGDGGAEIRKADFQALFTPSASSIPNTNYKDIKHQTSQDDSKRAQTDSLQNILFIGDSMLEGLSKRFADYADQNRHTLNSIIWYSSTSDTWANTDTLEYFIKKFEPTYIVICLGSNELFVKDISERRQNIRKIVDKLGNLPYVWISPPNWKEDTGINDAIITTVGKGRYFDSRGLDLARKKDHAHPTDAAAAVWMDTIAQWLKSSQCENPLLMEYPEKQGVKRSLTLLKPYNR